MSSQRWDLCVSHKDKKSDKWRSQKVGVIFQGDKGQLNIKIDPGISISSLEGVQITGWLPKEKDGQLGGGRADSGSYGGGGAGDDDGIPFAPVPDIG